MSTIPTYFINKRLSTPDNKTGYLNLKKYIQDVVDDITTKFSSIFTDTVSEKTAGNGVSVDGALIKDGGISANSMFAGFYPTAESNDIAAGTGGAIPVTNYLTTISTDADDDAFTLANGTQIGQVKLIKLVVDGGGEAVITPATNLTGGVNLITLDDADDFILLIWNGTAWAPLDASKAILNIP